MTRPKLVLMSHRKMWEPIVREIINGIIREESRTDNQGERAKIRIKFHKDFKHVVKWPKFVWVPCDDPDYVIREWRNCTILDHLYELTISPFSSHDIYSQRRGVLKSLDWMCKEIGID